VAMGGADTALLEEIAREGKGRFYHAEDISTIPQIFAKETVTASKSAIDEQPFVPQIIRKSHALSGVDLDSAPFLYRIRRVYVRIDKAIDIDLPAWPTGNSRVGALALLPAMDYLESELRELKSGELHFAHLLLPHYPYVLLPDCSFRPPSEWNARNDADAPQRTSNTPEGRDARYVQYLDQLECVYKDLDRLLDAIPKELQGDAVVILHGDHGSRIGIVDPDANSARALTSSDLTDAYSTLFAVRIPAVLAGEDERRVAVGCMLAAVVESGFTSASPDPSCNAEHTVFKVPPEGRVIDAPPVATTYAP